MYSLSLFSGSPSSSYKAKFLNMLILFTSPALSPISLSSFIENFSLVLKNFSQILCPFLTPFLFWSENFPRRLLSLSFAWLTPTYCLRFSSVICPFWIPIVLLAYFLPMHRFIVLSLSMCLWQYRMNDARVQFLLSNFSLQGLAHRRSSIITCWGNESAIWKP